jgi:autoinducer 2-degrading protein
MLVKVRIKPEERERFLKAIEVDAEGSERDEPGCLRFNVLQDEQEHNVYYFYAPEARRCRTVFPAPSGYWTKK